MIKSATSVCQISVWTTYVNFPERTASNQGSKVASQIFHQPVRPSILLKQSYKSCFHTQQPQHPGKWKLTHTFILPHKVFVCKPAAVSPGSSSGSIKGWGEFVGCSGVRPIESPPSSRGWEWGVVYLPVSNSGRLRLITASPRVDSI